jgi:hypothetical protein
MITISKKICSACVAGAVLLAGAFFLLPKGAHNGDALAGPANPATSQSGQTAAPDQWKINPADPLSPDGVSWTPLTGDGSN